MEKDNNSIILVGPTYPFRGGISHYTAMLFKALEKKYSVSLISFTRQYPSRLFPGKTQMDQSQVTFSVPNERVIDTINPFSWIKAFLAIRRQTSHVVVFQWWTPLFGLPFGTIARIIRLFTRIKVVFICHNVIPHERHWADRFFTRFALGSADKIVVHGEQQIQVAQRFVSRAKVVHSPHPTFDQFGLRGLSQSEARARLGIKGNTLLFFGYVRPYKGLRYLLESLPDVLRETEVNLVVAGEFYDEKTQYTDIIQSLRLERHVKVIDSYIENEEVETYFAACDLVVCPYISGTQSGVIQIAYSFNRPVVCTRVGGLPEVVVEGKTGFIVNPQDPQDLARGVLAYYGSNDRKDFPHHIEAIKKQFSWDGLIEAITDV